MAAWPCFTKMASTPCTDPSSSESVSICLAPAISSLILLILYLLPCFLYFSTSKRDVQQGGNSEESRRKKIEKDKRTVRRPPTQMRRMEG